MSQALIAGAYYFATSSLGHTSCMSWQAVEYVLGMPIGSAWRWPDAGRRLSLRALALTVCAAQKTPFDLLGFLRDIVLVWNLPLFSQAASP